MKLKDALQPELVSEQAFTQPFVTVAREPGSGGAPIAQSVAEKLGFIYVDEQIVDSIATSTKKRREIIKTVDEKTRTVIEDMVHSLFNKEYVDDIQYISELAKVILTYAHQGKTVILGRGANFLTPFAKGLHVMVTAPYDVRVQRAMEYEGHDKAKAKKVIAEVEKERAQFVKRYLSKNVNKKNSYDLILNTTSLSMDQSSDIIVEAFYRKFPRSVRYGGFLK